MKNIRLDIEYDGRDFAGWQKQINGVSIQGTLEALISKVLKKKTTIYGAGRTDSGAHAKNQVANFTSTATFEPELWRVILNNQLPKSIRITNATEVPPDFHAQKKAKGKIYEYRILNRPFASALDRNVLFYPKYLDWEAMRRAMPYFIGTKDFRSFQGAKADVKSTVRTIRRFELHRESEHLYRFEIEGNGFLKQMVRTIVGTLLEVGERKKTVESIPGIIEARNRLAAGRTAAAEGLCLVKVIYPEGLVLPTNSRGESPAPQSLETK